MTPEDQARDEFAFEMDSYIEAVMNEQECDFEHALDYAIGEYDEYYRAILESAERGELD